MTEKCGEALSWGENCDFPKGHSGAHGIELASLTRDFNRVVSKHRRAKSK